MLSRYKRIIICIKIYIDSNALDIVKLYDLGDLDSNVKYTDFEH